MLDRRERLSTTSMYIWDVAAFPIGWTSYRRGWLNVVSVVCYIKGNFDSSNDFTTWW
jgi:hypothetical protein